MGIQIVIYFILFLNSADHFRSCDPSAVARWHGCMHHHYLPHPSLFEVNALLAGRDLMLLRNSEGLLHPLLHFSEHSRREKSEKRMRGCVMEELLSSSFVIDITPTIWSYQSCRIPICDIKTLGFVSMALEAILSSQDSPSPCHAFRMLTSHFSSSTHPYDVTSQDPHMRTCVEMGRENWNDIAMRLMLFCSLSLFSPHITSQIPFHLFDMR